jgi:tetratricopeptide (TPR) repeat protein
LHQSFSLGGPLAGDIKAYEKAIRDGHNYAWEGKWEKALAAYESALAEMPDDLAIQRHLGLVYAELERYGDALEAYSKASRLTPKVAEIHERLGQRHAAADSLCALAEIHGREHDWSQAIQDLQHAIRLSPDHLPARIALAKVYAQLDQPQRAVKEYLNLARRFEEQGQGDKALEQCRRALEIDPRHLEARALAKALQAGESVEEVKVLLSRGENGASPVDMARETALAELANIPFEEAPIGPEDDAVETGIDGSMVETPGKRSSSRIQIDTLVARAIDCQTRGLIDEAIDHYTTLIDAGVDRPAAHFTLGLLRQQRMQFEPAIAEFNKAVTSPEYALGGYFALGECYHSLGQEGRALEQFIQALRIVDLGTVGEAQAEELGHLYDALADSYITQGDHEKASTFVNALIDFLSSEGWEEKAREHRQRLDSISEEGIAVSLAELLSAPNAETILTAMSLSQEYMDRGALAAATEACFDAIEAAPGHLPLHLRLGEILVQSGRVEDAVTKYQAVAELCLVRKERGQAAEVYGRMLRLQPMDVVVRSRLIDLLISSGEIDQALEEYVALADAYYDLAQPSKALEKCAEALRLASRASDETGWRVRLLHNMTEMHMRHGNWRDAVVLYRQLVAVAPDDERARLSLIDVCCKLGRTKEADTEAVAMYEHYRAQGEGARALALLEEAVRMQPQQMPLRARMARAYIDAGMQEEAIGELDALGELQLDAGLRKQAIATVRFIISLQPKNVEAYRQLLAQL